MVEDSLQIGAQTSDILTVPASTIIYRLPQIGAQTSDVLTATANTIAYELQIGTQTNDILTAPASTVTFGLRGDDILSTSVGSIGNSGYNSSVLVGGSGADQYIVANNSTAIILDDGNSAGDVIVAAGIGFNSITTSILEIDNLHLAAYDSASGQALIILDWQNPANTIESLQLSDGTFTYEYIASNFRNTGGYLGSYTLEQADQSLLGGSLSANGITSSSLYGLIATIKFWNALYGGAGNAFLSGLDGNDLLNQAAGANKSTSGDNDTFLVNNTSDDMLIGRLNNDTLVGNFADEILAANQRGDTITDFAVDDTTVVSAADFGGGLTIGAAIPAAEFVIGTATTDPFDRFIYTSNNSNLFLNTDATNSIVGV